MKKFFHHHIATTDRIKRIRHVGICNSIVDSWNKVQVSCVINVFKAPFNRILTTEIEMVYRQEIPLIYQKNL